MTDKSHNFPQNEIILRRLLWLCHGCRPEGQYGDDGEMQCNICIIDFKRLPAEDIDRAFQRSHKI